MKKYTILIIVALFFIVNNIVSAKLQEPYIYNEGECELVAKEFQNKFGGNLVLTIPYIGDKNVPGKYSGAWINKVYISGNDKYFYIDYSNQRIFSSKEEVKSFYSDLFTNKFENVNVYAKVFIYGEDNIPFPIIWNY